MKLFVLVISLIGIEPCVMSMHRMKQSFMFACSLYVKFQFFDVNFYSRVLISVVWIALQIGCDLSCIDN